DSAFDTADRLAEYAGAGAWNDLDMLVVGLKGKGAIGGGGLSFLEYQTHMSLWCFACSPLMIGCDLRTMDEQTLSLLTNPEVLAVNQDPLGKVGRRVARHGDCETWRKPLADGSMAVALFNRGSSGANVKLRAADIGLLDTPKAVRNLWKREDVADLGREATFRVQPHETILLSVRGL
ncbi:MAG: hypothetical protein H7Y38_00520, partial [Armatimonadetes bacterium]|nr:hypothetical protein [Armatimonadota bacterium]